MLEVERFKFKKELPFQWFIYLPFVGWIYAFLFRTDDQFCMHHATNAVKMAGFFTAVPTLLTFLIVFLPASFRWVRLITVLLIWLSHLAYFALCGLGTYRIYKGSKEDFPYVQEYLNKIDLWGDAK